MLAFRPQVAVGAAYRGDMSLPMGRTPCIEGCTGARRGSISDGRGRAESVGPRFSSGDLRKNEPRAGERTSGAQTRSLHRAPRDAILTSSPARSAPEDFAVRMARPSEERRAAQALATPSRAFRSRLDPTRFRSPGIVTTWPRRPVPRRSALRPLAVSPRSSDCPSRATAKHCSIEISWGQVFEMACGFPVGKGRFRNDRGTLRRENPRPRDPLRRCPLPRLDAAGAQSARPGFVPVQGSCRAARAPDCLDPARKGTARSAR
jgi:hypothetical protein